VGTVRGKLEDAGEVSKLDTRTDKRGYARPAGVSKSDRQRSKRRSGKSQTSQPPEPPSREDKMVEAMVASFRDGLGKAKVLPSERVRAALAPLRSDLLGMLGKDIDQKEA
jgi:hypothetical protein